MKTHGNSLDDIMIATPCSARWEEMAGDDRTRFCSHCSLNVYNISAMRGDEAEALIAKAEGRICVRFYRRSDGTVLTEDCPVGLRGLRRRAVRSVRNVAATIATVVAGIIGFGSMQACSPRGVEMGGLVESPPPPRADSTVQQDTATMKQNILEPDIRKHPKE